MLRLLGGRSRKLTVGLREMLELKMGFGGMDGDLPLEKRGDRGTTGLIGDGTGEIRSSSRTSARRDKFSRLTVLGIGRKPGEWAV